MRRALSALVLASIAALPAMAHASPPDPIWIVGMYDDGDQDDLIALAAWASGGTGAPLDVQHNRKLCPGEEAAAAATIGQ